MSFPLDIAEALFAGTQTAGSLLVGFKGNAGGCFRFEDDGPLGAGLDTGGAAAAEVADIDDSLLDLDGPDRAVRLAGAAERAGRLADDDLAQEPDGDGVVRAAKAIAFAALGAGDRSVNARFVDLDDFNSGEAAADPSRAEEGAGDLATPTARAPGDVDADHFFFLRPEEDETGRGA